jgi:uncharacterized delta-60 repeat protein
MYIIVLIILFAICLVPAQTERWVYQYNGLGDSPDCAYSIVQDQEGNLFLAGDSYGTGTENDFIIINLTSTGTERWVYRYNGAGNSNDGANSIAYGLDGNIYAAGYSSENSEADFTVISLTPAGTQRWVYQYNGPGDSTDCAHSIVCGEDGNIYVTGCSYDSINGKDITVISLTSAGVERWIYRYNGPANNMDWANSIVYGQDGNLYVGGVSIGNSGKDFTVISLTSTGTERWVYQYDGPGNNMDWVNEVVYGSDGNIYAAGASFASSTVLDFTVISLTSTGAERWVYRYAGPSIGSDCAYSIVYGQDGNVYAAGHSYLDSTVNDLTVISLTSTGVERWVYRYNGPGNNMDWANSIVYGTDGNLYAGGMSVGSGIERDLIVISLTNAGVERWVYRYDGPGNNDDGAYSIIYDQNGEVYIGGKSSGLFSGEDITVVSLTNIGIERWVYKYGGPGGGKDFAYSVAYGTDGNVYVAGSSSDGGIMYDFAIISLTDTGSERWVYRCNGHGNDQAHAIVYGQDGNVYAAGVSSCQSPALDFTVVSLTSAGAERWLYRYNGLGDTVDCAHSIVYGEDGNIYAAGYSTGEGTGSDFTVVSLTNTGVERWLFIYAVQCSGDDKSYSIAYGQDGNIYVAGTSWNDSSWYDVTVVSLTSTGIERWVYRYTGPASSGDWAHSIVYGEDGNVYVAGRSAAALNNYDFTVISLTPAGIQRWVYQYNGPGDSDDCAYAIVYGQDANIYVAGYSTDMDSTFDFTVISLTSAGTERWVYQYGGFGRAYSIVCSPAGHVYAAGWSVENNSTMIDFTIISLTSDGSERWVYRYDSPANYDDRAFSITYGQDGNLYAGGWSYNNITNYDFTVISLEAEVGIAEGKVFDRRRHPSFEVYPNPFRQILNIYFSISIDTDLSIKVYDVSGRLVKTIQNSMVSGNYILKWHGDDDCGRAVSQGIYFVQIKNLDSGETSVHKVLKVR